jgi:phage terminase large subunit
MDPPEGAPLAERIRVEELRLIEKAICAKDVVHWFNTWVWTFNPKLVGVKDAMAWMPMDLFPKQEEFVRWFLRISDNKEDGHCAKSRDIGFTWMAGGVTLNKWLFQDGYKANFGSRKAEYVDRIGDPDSIFEKLRMLRRGLPHWMLPSSNAMHDNSMLLINEERGSVIRGEAGDDMGRGGRSTDYVFDEFAFVEHADSVDAASVANADCRLFGSTVNGQGNLFFRKAHDGSMRPDQLFRFHWSDDPRKRDGMVELRVPGQPIVVVSWEKATRSKMEKHKFASEYDIDYSASVEGICIEAKWVEACKRIRSALAKRGIQMPVVMQGVAGGDVGAGKAKSVLVPRFGSVVHVPTSWSDPDTVDTANRMLIAAASIKPTRDGFIGGVKNLRFDATGVGHGVGSVLKRSHESIASHAVLVGNPASESLWPDGKKSNEKFANIKAESWWICRERAKNSYELLQFLENPILQDGTSNPEAIEHELDDILVLPADSESPDAMTMNSQLSLVKWLTTVGGKIIIESKEDLKKRGISSPDHADALMLTFVPETTAEKLMRAFA